MKKTVFLFLLVLFLSGCATYKFQVGKEPYDQGYVVSRDDYAIPEYSIGQDNSAPNLELARERFHRRRRIVERYYNKMGYIESRFKMVFWDSPVMFLKLVGGVSRLPFIAISDFRYAHNSKYRERVRKIEDEKDAREEARIKNLKEALYAYIQHDIASEQDRVAWEKTEEKKPTQKEILDETLDLIEQGMVKEKQPDIRIKEKPKIRIEKKAKQASSKHTELLRQPTAIIIAKPAKGFSPLRVHFYGYKSYVPKGKIVSYLWDFGDGDTSTMENPVNTYYSTTFQPQYFTATLTIQDDKGNTAKVSTSIEVINK
jgi:hypothetical protein